MTTINIRTDEKRKKLATAILKEMGLDMSSAIQLFLQQVIITKSIPFPIRTVNGFTPAFEEAVLAAEHEDSSEAFETADDAIAFLHKESKQAA